MRLFRFRNFRFRLLALLLGLLILALTATYVLVSRANLQTALAHSEANLEVGSRTYQEAINQQIDSLAHGAAVMSGDYAIQQMLQAEHPDTLALSSTLQGYTGRVGAPVIALFDPDRQLIANSDAKADNENRRPFRYLIQLANGTGQPQASGFSYLNQELHALVVVPLYSPYPKIIGWFGLAFPINQKFAQKIKGITGIEVTFVDTEKDALTPVLATTLPASSAQWVAHAAVKNLQDHRRIMTLELPGERYLTLFDEQEMLGEDSVAVVLQRPLSVELAAAHDLENEILLISAAALAGAAIMAMWIARGVSQPVRALAQHTQLIAQGDYSTRITLDRVDELGQLADSFNAMSVGLAERDLVRDLLDKNVSPEVAAQLLRDGSGLGGEEREVTILFADLRDFTTLSERLAPRELLALLNRYLDRMSAEIERQGGVIDKYVGDAIMALFGAPVSQTDAAQRAFTAALAMKEALAGLNAEFAAEGRPPLAIGVGINTAQVIAGNIGSHRRLNYSVIGDGVNVAARLQSLTRRAEYHATIIASAASVHACRTTAEVENYTARPLGSVQVKGRAAAVEIFAIEHPRM